MNVRAFVILSSLTLCAWLGATFVRVVPMHTYSGGASAPGQAEVVEQPMVAVEGE